METRATTSGTAAATDHTAGHTPKSMSKIPLLELFIFTNCVGLYPQPPRLITSDELAHSAMMTGTNPTSPSGLTCLLSGPLDDFLLYSRQERSQWLIDIAHDICDPALKRGSLQVWDAAGEMRRNVNPTEPLTASRYHYDVQAIASLSKISERVGRSRTTVSGNASTMANRVKQRDGQQCWVTRMDSPITNSHICPKRMGDHLLRVVYSAFVSAPPPPTLSIYDEICGITLDRNLDAWFDTYELGLRLVAPVRSSSFLVFYSKSLIHEFRIGMNATHFVRLPCHKTCDSFNPGIYSLPVYMGTGLVPLSPNMPATPHLA
jgi:hypothetical protein